MRSVSAGGARTQRTGGYYLCSNIRSAVLTSGFPTCRTSRRSRRTRSRRGSTAHPNSCGRRSIRSARTEESSRNGSSRSCSPLTAARSRAICWRSRCARKSAARRRKPPCRTRSARFRSLSRRARRAAGRRPPPGTPQCRPIWTAFSFSAPTRATARIASSFRSASRRVRC